MNYEEQQNPRLCDPKLHSLQEFISEGDESSPLGMDLREDQCKLNSGDPPRDAHQQRPWQSSRCPRPDSARWSRWFRV